MADYRATLFFEAAAAGGGVGWSESWYRIAATHNDVVGPLNDLKEKRRGCLSANWRIRYGRISDLDKPRDALPLAYGPGDSEGLLGVPGPLADPTPRAQYYDAVYARATTVGYAHRRSIHLRGISSDAILPSGQIDDTAIWFARFDLFRTYLLSSDWMIRFQSGGGVVNGIFVVEPTPAETRSVRLIHPTGWTGLTPGDDLLLSGASAGYPINGVWRVRQAIGVNLDTYPKRRNVDFPGSGVVTVNVKNLFYLLGEIASIEVIRGVSKKTGRPFGLPRGRRNPIKT